MYSHTHRVTPSEPQELADAPDVSLGVQLHTYMHTSTHKQREAHARTHTQRVASAEFISLSIFTNAANQVDLQAEKTHPRCDAVTRLLSSTLGGNSFPGLPQLYATSQPAAMPGRVLLWRAEPAGQSAW